MSNDENMSLLGLTLDELGKTSVKVIHRDGSIETHPLEMTTTKSSSENPLGTWKHVGPALEKKDIAGVSRKDRIDQSLRVEATLIKCFTSPTGISELSDKQCRNILKEILKAFGGEWAEKIED